MRQLLRTVADTYSPSFDLLLDFSSLSLDSIDGLVLLLNKDTHLNFKVQSGNQPDNVDEETNIVE